MKIVPLFLIIDTNDDAVARKLVEDVTSSEQRSHRVKVHVTAPETDVMVDYEMHAVEHRGESPIVLEGGEMDVIRSYVPVRGRRVRS
jgi:hypothetical protein